MTKAEAMRSICAGAAALLDNGSENLWISQDEHGNKYPPADASRRIEAFDKLVAELRRRGGVR